MSKKDDALKLALEALEDVDGVDTETECVTIDVGEAIAAIKEALAEHTEQPLEMVAEQPAQDQGQSCYCPNCEALSKELAALKAQQQEPPTVAELLCVCGAEWEWRNRDWELVATPPASNPLTGILSIAYSGGRVVTCSFKTEAEAKAFEQYAIEVAHQIGVNK